MHIMPRSPLALWSLERVVSETEPGQSWLWCFCSLSLVSALQGIGEGELNLLTLAAFSCLTASVWGQYSSQRG